MQDICCFMELVIVLGLAGVELTVRDLLLHLDNQKSMRPDEIQTRVLRELADVIAGLLAIIYQQSWSLGEVPMTVDSLM